MVGQSLKVISGGGGSGGGGGGAVVTAAAAATAGGAGGSAVRVPYIGKTLLCVCNRCHRSCSSICNVRNDLSSTSPTHIFKGKIAVTNPMALRFLLSGTS